MRAIYLALEALIESTDARYGAFASTHEALGVASEEWDELRDAIRSNDLGAVEHECIDLAAVLLRLARDLRESDSTQKRSVKDPVAEKKKRPKPVECPYSVDTQVWNDWLALRKAKRAPVTATVLDGAIAEAAKAGMTLDAFLRVWCSRGSQGLEAGWIKPAERNGTETAWQRSQRERVAEMTGGLVSRSAPGAVTIEFTDATAPRPVG